MHYTLIGCMLLALSCGVVPTARGKQLQADKGSDEDRVAEARKITRTVAQSLKLHGGESGTQKLEIFSSPLQQFTNSIVGEFYAHLFIWTHDGRPAAVASILKWYAPFETLQVAFQSLSLRPITAKYQGTKIWHSEQAGVRFQEIPDSPLPAESSLARLRQMLELARQYKVEIEAVNCRVDIDEELRLIDLPLHRYADHSGEVLDGALFSFARGTDPELLMTIEARK